MILSLFSLITWQTESAVLDAISGAPILNISAWKKCYQATCWWTKCVARNSLHQPECWKPYWSSAYFNYALGINRFSTIYVHNLQSAGPASPAWLDLRKIWHRPFTKTGSDSDLIKAQKPSNMLPGASRYSQYGYPGNRHAVFSRRRSNAEAFDIYFWKRLVPLLKNLQKEFRVESES